MVKVEFLTLHYIKCHTMAAVTSLCMGDLLLTPNLTSKIEVILHDRYLLSVDGTKQLPAPNS